MEQDAFIKLRKDYYIHKNNSLTKKIKESIFGVIFVLLKEEEEFEFLEQFLFIFEFLEFMIFPFNPEIRSVWQNDNITDTVETIFSYFSILTYISDRSATLYLTGLYISFASITLVLINIGYVSYSFSRKYFTITWPLYVLRTVAKIFVTGLFMPLFELNLSIFDCEKDEDGVWVAKATSDLKCYTPTHFVHMGIGLIVTFIFLIISLFVALTYYENSEINGGDGAKENSRADFAIMISKIVSTFCSTFFTDKKYQWLIICTNFVFSMFQVGRMYIDRPYYDFKQMGMVMCLNGVYMWSNFMLLMCKIFSNYKFEGGFYIWLLGCPLLGFTFYCGTDESRKVLSKGINLCKTCEEVQRHLRYLLTVSEHLNQRDENNMILQGYIFNHTCQDLQCPLCEYKRSSSVNCGTSFSSIESSTQTAKNFLYEYIENNYNKEISRYPNSTSLRIAYAMFLYDRKEDKALALQQFTSAEKYNPLLDEEFIIYRYCKMINEENERASHLSNGEFEEEEKLDIVSSIAYNSHFHQCLYNIKHSAELYINFWEKIINSTNQDLGALNEMAVSINSANKNIEIHWKKLIDIKPNDPKAFKIYGGFVKNVLNNKDKGNDLMAIGYETSDKKPNSVGYLNFSIEEEYVQLSKEGSSFIICSMEEKSFGNILRCSKMTMKYFGFTEKELIAYKNIKNVFVECYAKSILGFIKAELDKNIDTLLQSKQYLMFIKHKSNKPQEVYVIFRKYKGVHMKDRTFVAIFINDQENRENIKLYIKNTFFIVDQDLKVKYMTNGAIDLLGKLQRKIPEDYGIFSKLFPEFEFREDENDEEAPPHIEVVNEYVILNEEIGCKIAISPLEGYASDENVLFVIKLQTMPKNKMSKTQKKTINIRPTYIYPKISALYKKDVSNSTNMGAFSPSQSPALKAQKSGSASKIISFYEFSSTEKNRNMFPLMSGVEDEVDEDGSSDSSKSNFTKKNSSKKSEDYSDEIKDNVLPLTKVEANESEVLIRNRQSFENLSSDEFRRKLETLKNYGKGVNFYMVKIKKTEIEKIEHFQPRIIDIVRDRKHSLTITDSLQLNKTSDFSNPKLQKNNFAQKSKVDSSVTNLGFVSFILLIVFLAYTIVEYLLNESSITSKKNSFDMMSISFDSIEYFQLCQIFLRNLVLVNNPQYTNYHNMQKEEFVKYNLDKINSYTDLLSEIQYNLTLYSKGLLKEHKRLFEESSVDFLTTSSGLATKVGFTFLHAFKMQLNLLLSILHIDTSLISYSDNFVVEYMYNNLNEFFIASLQSVKMFYELIEKKSKNDIIEDACICVLNFAVSIVVVVYLYKRITSIEIERTKMLKSFYKIPKFYLRSLADKSKIFVQKIEKYITNIEEEENQNKSNNDDNSSANSDTTEKEDFISKGNVAEYSSNATASTLSYTKELSYLPRALAFVMLLLTYFCVSFITNTVSTSDTRTLNTNFFHNSFYCVNATSLYNILIEKILDSQQLIFLTTSLDILQPTFNDFAKLQIDIVESNGDSYSVFSSSLIDSLVSIQNGDICQIEEINRQIDDCDAKLNYISNFGSDIILSAFLENLRIAYNNVFDNVSSNSTVKIQLLNGEHFYFLNELIYDYLRVYLGFWKTSLLEFISNYLNKQRNLNTILLAVFECIIAGIFLFFWIPFLLSLKESIFQTQMMIDVIPEEILSKINFNDNSQQVLTD